MTKEKPKTPGPSEAAKLPKANDRTGADPEKDSAESTSSDEQRPDFGGLPDRNLKKNLGCG